MSWASNDSNRYEVPKTFIIKLTEADTKNPFLSYENNLQSIHNYSLFNEGMSLQCCESIQNTMCTLFKNRFYEACIYIFDFD